MDEKKKKTVRIIVTLAVVAIIAVSALAVACNLNGGSMDFSNREVRIVLTNSMDHDSHTGIVKTNIASIPVGSMIMIHKLDDSGKRELAVGDVISFWNGSSLYTHRIIEISWDRETFTTRGDNASSADAPISASQIYGKVVGLNTPIGRIANNIQQNPIIGIALVAQISLLVGVIEYILKVLREEKDEK